MFERLVLAIDGSPAGGVGLSFVTAVARTHRSAVHVVHANLVVIAGRGVTAESGEYASRVVSDAVDQLGASGLEATGELVTVPYFHLGPRVAEVADRFGADAIVLGSHRLRGPGRLFGHGMRERITRATPLPVLVAPVPLRVGRMHRAGPVTGHRPLSPSGPPGPEG